MSEKLRVILTGATGMDGEGVLIELVQAPPEVIAGLGS
jgi:hypothetical protein